jgi:hypothetical protein
MSHVVRAASTCAVQVLFVTRLTALAPSTPDGSDASNQMIVPDMNGLQRESRRPPPHHNGLLSAMNRCTMVGMVR